VRHHPPLVLVDRYLTSQIEIRLNCHILGRSAPLLLHCRKAYAGPFGFVPGGRATWFADYLQICGAHFGGAANPVFPQENAVH
jgi:hypothetical protein